MPDIISHKTVENRIIELRGNKVIIDSDVAELYGVETKHINQAVRNNPDRFISGFTIELDSTEKNELVKNFDRFERLKHSTSLPKAFTEPGLYMLATVLKSPSAVQTTLAIIQTFTRVREINRTIVEVLNEKDQSTRQKSLTNHVGELIGELIMPNEEDLETVAIETEAKFKFFTMLEISRKVIKKPKK